MTNQAVDARCDRGGITSLFGGRGRETEADNELRIRLPVDGKSYDVQLKHAGPHPATPDSKTGAHSGKTCECMFLIDSSFSMYAPLQVDETTDFRDTPDTEEQPTRIEVAAQFVREVVGRLQSDDLVSVLAFNTTSEQVTSRRRVSEIDGESIERAITDIRPRNGTNTSVGLEAARAEVEPTTRAGDGVTRRCVLLTDAQPALNPETETRFVKGVTDLRERGVATSIAKLGGPLCPESESELLPIEDTELIEIL
jgi:hypothetical protein